jgi:hypothetical protein
MGRKRGKREKVNFKMGPYTGNYVSKCKKSAENNGTREN